MLLAFSTGERQINPSLKKSAIGEDTRVTVSADGHFLVGDERVRFLGINFAGDSPFMPTNKAEAVAARLAKFGVNCVRFHHMDAPWAAGGGLLSYTSTSSRTVNPAQLERVHFLVSRLKAHGIYSDINLLVGREYRSGDGLGSEVATMDWKDQHILGFFNDTALALHREYATRLLTPVNPFTGLSLAQDPAVAFVEIINENGVVQKWLDGGLDRLPTRYAGQLQTRWNDWLGVRYADDAGLLAAWNVVNQPLGVTLLKNGDFASGLTGWNQERHDTAQASFSRTTEFTGGKPSARIQVTTVGSANWHVQFNQPGLRVTRDHVYTLTFAAKAGAAGTPLALSLMQAHDPWQAIGLARTVSLGSEWRLYTNTFAATATDANARVNFGGFGDRLATVWIADARLQPGGQLGEPPQGASLASRTLPNVRQSGDGFTGTAEARNDWLRFLRDLETAYYDAMVGHLRAHCACGGLIFGTIMANSPATVQSRLDAVDAHAYWQHPQFPGQPWDSVNWTVGNVALVNTIGDDNPLTGLARQRIQGKPFTVTEYQHPAPNQYNAEAPLLLAAYAALQDWDGIWLFDYGPGQDSVAMGRIRGFFDTAQHPAKMANLLVAANLFRRADVAPAHLEYTLALEPTAEIDLLRRQASAWSVFTGAQLGLPTRLPFVSRVSTDVGPDATGLPTPPANPINAVLASDTGELIWNLATAGRGFVSINTPRTKALIGFADQREVNWGGIRIMPKTTQLGFCTIALTLVRGDSLTNHGTALLVAAGQCENTGMKWKDASKNSVGNQWGSPPTLIEVVPFALTLPVASDRVQAWALDPFGQRIEQLPLADTPSGSTVITNAASAATLWYEITVTAPALTQFDHWRGLHFTPAQLAEPLVSGAEAAPAGDAVANFVKYALALDPWQAASRHDLAHWFLSTNNGRARLAVRYIRAKGLRDAFAHPLFSDDLTNWLPSTGEGQPHTIEDLGATERITIESDAGLSANQPIYGHLVVERTAPRLLPPPHVEIHGGQNNKSLDDVLQREMDAGLVQSFVENADNDSADERARHRPDPARKARAADNHGGDGIEFEPLSGRGLRRVELRRVNDPGQTGKRRAQHINDNLVARNSDARKARRLAVASNRVEMLPEARAMQQHGHQAQCCRHEQDRHRQRTEQPGIPQGQKQPLGVRDRQGPPLVETQSDTPRHQHRRQRDDERRHPRLRRARAIDGPERGRDRQPTQQSDPAAAPRQQRDCNGAHQCDHGANRKIDAANENHQGHPARENGVHGNLLGEIQQVLRTQEPRHAESGQPQQNGHRHQQRHQVSKRFHGSVVGTAFSCASVPPSRPRRSSGRRAPRARCAPRGTPPADATGSTLPADRMR